MRKGQISLVPNFFSDILPGLFILLLAYAFFAFVDRDVSTNSLDALRFQDSYDRAFATFLHSSITPITYVGDAAKTQQATYLATHYTYGDLLFLATLDKQDATLYHNVFTSGIRSDLRSVSSLAFQQDSQWFFNFSSPDPLFFDDQGGSLTPAYISKPSAQSSHITFYYPLPHSQIPILITAALGTKEYVYA